METVLLTILILIVISVVGYILLYNNLQAYNIKINEAESIIDDLLRKKYDTLDNMKVIILKETDLLPNTFEIFENMSFSKMWLTVSFNYIFFYFLNR